MLSVLLIYYIGKMMFNEKVGLYSACFLTLLPLHVFYSGRILTDVFSLFFVLLTIYAFWKGYEEEESKYKVLFGLFFGLSVLSRYTCILLGVVFLVYFLYKHKSLRFLKDKYLWQAVGIFILTLVPIFVYGRIVYGNLFGAFIHGTRASSYWGGVQQWNWFFVQWTGMFSIIGVVFILALGYLAYKKELFEKENLLLLLLFFVFLGFAIAMPHKEDRYILPIVVALCLLSGVFIDRIKKNTKVIFALLIIILVCSNIYSFNSNYNSNNPPSSKCEVMAFDYLKSISGDYVTFNENSPVYYYFLKKESNYYMDSLDSIKSFSENKSVYFIIADSDFIWGAEKVNKYRTFLRDNYNLKLNCSIGGFNLDVYSN
jgi:4-amino-4-deoxy-L-arabinose transferase-like glycosyltransferase